MKTILSIITLLLFSFSTFSQTAEIRNNIKKTKQSYEDRGYVLIYEKSDSLQKLEMLVSDTILFLGNTTYLVVASLGGCYYCEYDMYFIDEENNMTAIEYEKIVRDEQREGLYRFKNTEFASKRILLVLKSDLPYYTSIFVFKVEKF